jgi:hypothetical protein
MAAQNFLNRKIHPGLTIDPKVWEPFKKKYSNNVSQAVEDLMKQALYPPGEPQEILSSAAVNSISIQDAASWTANYSAGALNLTNTSCCYSAGTTSIDPKDIIIK